MSRRLIHGNPRRVDSDASLIGRGSGDKKADWVAVVTAKGASLAALRKSHLWGTPLYVEKNDVVLGFQGPRLAEVM